MSKSNAFTSVPAGLPLDGFSRWENLRRFIPLSRETVRQRELEGRFPRASRLTQRCTVWSNREIHRWIADPLNYRSDDAMHTATEGA
ncbi:MULTISPECIES: helix-turn-helix transcriptional regulator [Burkholderia]|uniref:helix-turn-helix transcriptional regulator n=1 Tax=Burkholderia TaxID=32008 RepID=UPI00163FD6D9|nr:MULTISPECIES: AlpA family phage regulatory protein [Burkholderia]MBU9320651.1 AlpA family transcriptional regulator [Burkholderia gladioli]MBU9645307.1 AlpA family transcriptional regulator [Burkholderia gladioli]MCM2539101.1 AlpA family transcriptional regulator [Burkholderia glumae]MDN7462720.1 AlpA family phage regulatory protein [Burkholderia gladioli]